MISVNRCETLPQIHKNANHFRKQHATLQIWQTLLIVQTGSLLRTQPSELRCAELES